MAYKRGDNRSKCNLKNDFRLVNRDRRGLLGPCTTNDAAISAASDLGRVAQPHPVRLAANRRCVDLRKSLLYRTIFSRRRSIGAQFSAPPEKKNPIA